MFIPEFRRAECNEKKGFEKKGKTGKRLKTKTWISCIFVKEHLKQQLINEIKL